MQRSPNGQLSRLQFDNTLFLTNLFAAFEIRNGDQGLRIDEFGIDEQEPALSLPPVTVEYYKGYNACHSSLTLNSLGATIASMYFRQLRVACGLTLLLACGDGTLARSDDEPSDPELPGLCGVDNTDLRQAVQRSRVASGYLLLDQVQTLGLDDIFDLHGLGCLENLNTLSLVLSEGQVSSLAPLAKLNKLRELYLYGPGEFSNLNALKELELTHFWSDGTGLTDLDFLSGQSKLRELTLYERQLSDLSGVSDAVALRRATISGRRVTDLGALSGLPALIYLELLSEDLLSLESLAGQPSLTVLTLRQSQVSNLAPLAQMPKLEILTVHQGHFVDLAGLGGHPSLHTLRLMGGGLLTDISALSDGCQLVELAISDNPLEDLTGLQACFSLERMWLQTMGIRDLMPLTNLSLVDVALQNNAITSLMPLDSQPLTRLSVSGNPLNSLSGLGNSTALEALNVSRTGIEDLGPLANSPLHTLEATDNKIVDLSPLGSRVFDTLNLQNNLISALPDGFAPTVGSSSPFDCPEVDLSNNPLDELTLTETLPQLCSHLSDWYGLWWDGGNCSYCPSPL